jgi:FdhD protein
MSPPEGSAIVPSDRGPACVIDEAPLVIQVGDSQILTMRTPGSDRDLALGFLLAEGILLDLAHIERIECTPRGEASAVDCVRAHVIPTVTLAPHVRERLSRAHAIRPSCGVCGLATAEGLTRDLRHPAPGTPRTSLVTLSAMERSMAASQHLFQATGGCHAAGVFDAATGAPWAVREDVGRHNALDKALGACLSAGRDLSQAAVVLSGRTGYELVLKVLRLGVPILASVSAPSRLSVELASEGALTLVGFLRDGTGRVYWDEERLT